MSNEKERAEAGRALGKIAQDKYGNAHRKRGGMVHALNLKKMTKAELSERMKKVRAGVQLST